MPKVLTNLRIDEVSAVDKGAGKGARIVLIKRATAPGATPADTLRAWPNPNTFNAVLARMEAEEMAKAADDGDHDGDHDASAPVGDHHVSRLADLLVESGRFTDRGHALRHLTSHPDGVALVRTHKTEKESHPMKSYERWQDIIKSHGVNGLVEVAKNIAEEQKSFGISETEFVSLIDAAARVTHPELGARAFEKVYERNPVLARAISVIKAGLAEQLLSGGMPVQVVGGEDAQDVDNATAALDAYNELVRIGRERWSHLSPAQQFEKAFEANPELARKAHRRPTPPMAGAYPHPR